MTVISESADEVGLHTAYEIAEMFRWIEEDLEVYDYWSMKLQDERGAIVFAERRAEERGETRGRHAEKVDMARLLMVDGMSDEVIAKYTGLSGEEVIQSQTRRGGGIL